MSVRISSYMSTPVVAVGPNDNLAHVRNLMIKFKIGRVVVVDDDHVAGILTWTDLMKSLLSMEKDWATRPIDMILAKEVMTQNPVMIRSSKSIRLAAKNMIKRGISGLPAVNQQSELKGMITKTDVVRAMPKTRASKLTVEQVMSTPVVSATPFHTVYRAAALMSEHRIAHLVIEEGGTPVGIISKSDLASYVPLVGIDSGSDAHPSFIKLKRLRFGVPHQARMYNVPIAADLMTTSLVVSRPDATLLEASQVMLRRGISSLPVVSENDALIGIISKSDLVKAVARYR
ncbi:MAG: CBS domain-containing protein [Thermoprotei archaeon]